MKKILIVDDEKNIILSLKMLLIKEKFQVLTAMDGIEAVNMAQEHIPDIIFLDIVLPKLNGYLVCEALKEDINTKNIPVIFISAKTQEEDIKRAFKVGGDDYIVKPFTYQEIQNSIHKYIEEDEGNE
ncbi:response regulator transcription factor [Tepidibacter mesophilus]|uniref:response regulator transcription factor n=1 Tax=Tepidibacter mesophilus TaxID=655607 RepID=UPI000C083312|nr:response regulator [Tepidibacter mesophilus]